MSTRIRSVTLLDEETAQARTRAIPTEWRVLCRELPHVVSTGRHAGRGTPMRVALARWSATDCDPATLDRRLHALSAPVDLHLVAGSADDERAAVEVLTRAQIFLPAGATERGGSPLQRVLRLHRRLHDLEKPLVAADYWHAHDTHRWVLRLRPQASAALQVAALFHDAERLLTEADVRVEQHAADYQAFKDAHARTGARLLGEWLRELKLDKEIVRRAAALVADHERHAQDAEAQTLADADALSFFSLNSPGFLDYYGPEHTARKVAYTLGRLSPGERWRLSWIKLRADVAEIVRQVARKEACA